MKRHGTYTILGIAFFYVGRYGGDFVDKYGSRYLDIQVFCLLFSFPFFPFVGHWKGIKVTSMHNVHNSTHLLMN
jgi:hypothetical protein